MTKLIRIEAGKPTKLAEWPIVQFAKFSFVGVVNTVVHYAVFLLLAKALGINVYVATTVGYAAGVLNSFLLNRRWTFNLHGRGSLKEFVSFVAVYGVAFVVNVAVLHVLIRYWSMAPEIAQLFAIAASLAINFLGQKIWTFGNVARRDPA